MPASYITVARFKLLSTIPSGFVDTVESQEPGFVQAQLELWSDWLDSQLRKRYAAPFAAPVPLVVELWIARVVTPRVWSKRGVDPNDEQWGEVKKDDLDARAEIALAANSETGLYELPLRADKLLESGVARAFPRGYSEQSPYVFTNTQVERARQEDDAGHGSFY